MSEWTYRPDEYARTRTISVGQDSDGAWRWRRNRTGPNRKEVAQAVSAGFDEAKWMYANAVKENYPLPVPVPDGVEPITVVEPEPEEPVVVEGDVDGDGDVDDDDHRISEPQPEA